MCGPQQLSAYRHLYDSKDTTYTDLYISCINCQTGCYTLTSHIPDPQQLHVTIASGDAPK